MRFSGISHPLLPAPGIGVAKRLIGTGCLERYPPN